jgi:hypothetical protein
MDTLKRRVWGERMQIILVFTLVSKHRMQIILVFTLVSKHRMQIILVFTLVSKHLHGPCKCQKFGCVSDLHVYGIYTLYTQLLTLTHNTGNVLK